MTNDHGIVTGRRQFTARGEGYGNIVKGYPGLQREGGDDDGSLVCYEFRVGIFGLGSESLYGI